MKHRYLALVALLLLSLPVAADQLSVVTYSTGASSGGGASLTATNDFLGTNNFTSPVTVYQTTTHTGNNWVSLAHNGTNSVMDMGAGAFVQRAGGFNLLYSDANSLKAVGSIGLGFTATSDAAAVSDSGIARYASGVVKVVPSGAAINVRALLGGGTAVASATAMPVPTGGVFHVTGTTDITSITATNFQAGVCFTIIFDGVLNFTDGNNLKLAATMATTADDTISLCYDGTNFFETGRAVN